MDEQFFIEILLIHFLADFGLITEEQAVKKRRGRRFANVYLLRHVLTYSLVWFVWLIAHSYNHYVIVLATLYIFMTHYLTDWITARFPRFFFKENTYHDSYVSVGVDQILHYISLIAMFMVIFQYFSNTIHF